MFKTGIISTIPFLFVLFLFTAFHVHGQDKTHVVKSGETLSGIAKKYKTTIQEIIGLNPDAEKGLKAGGTLILPGKSHPEEVKSQIKSLDGNQKQHVVKSGESLSKIAKLYKVPVKDLESWNGITNKDLKAGQSIIVSESLQETAVKPEVKSTKIINEAEPESAGVHVVGKGETLSAIARKVGITVAELKKLNGLKNNQVNLGQELKLPAGMEDGPKVVKKNEKSEVVKVVKEPTPKTEPQKQQPEEKVEVVIQKPAVQEKPMPVVAAPPASEIPLKEPEKASNGIREVNNTLGYTRVVETGFAEAIEGDVNSKKHLCLNKSAPIGSILQVRNEVNGQSVFVKVIGKLPEIGSNEKLIIRISRQAYDKLLAVGKRFPVEVSYPEAQ